jgi:predicted permease
MTMCIVGLNNNTLNDALGRIFNYSLLLPSLLLNGLFKLTLKNLKDVKQISVFLLSCFLSLCSKSS